MQEKGSCQDQRTQGGREGKTEEDGRTCSEGNVFGTQISDMEQSSHARYGRGSRLAKAVEMLVFGFRQTEHHRYLMMTLLSTWMLPVGKSYGNLRKVWSRGRSIQWGEYSRSQQVSTPWRDGKRRNSVSLVFVEREFWRRLEGSVEQGEC